MSKTRKFLGIVAIVMLLSMAFATPALAFEGRGGEDVVVAANEVIDDDLYVGATNFTLEGTVNGDLYAAGQTVTINGTVAGNLFAAANTVVVNGKVEGDVFAAGAALQWGPESDVGGDVLGAGASLEFKEGSEVGRDALLAGGQVLLGANVAGDVQVGTGALEIAGTIGGDVWAEVGEATEGQPPMMWTGPSSITMPSVAPGLTIDPDAQIAGDLEYTQNVELSFPAGVVAGEIVRKLQPIESGEAADAATAVPENLTAKWALKSVRALMTLIILGLLLVWLLPSMMKSLSEKLRTRPWMSLGSGVIGWAAFFFLFFAILTVMILLAVLFGVLTLGGLSASVVWTGLLVLFALILGFVLITTFLAKIVFGTALGEWILRAAKSPLAEHKVWPMVIGVLITVVVLSLLAFPGVPGGIAWLFNTAVVLFGLGAVALKMWRAMRPEATAV